MAGAHPPTGTPSGSTPGNLPASNPQPVAMVDHSFTLQSVMELQRSVGGLTTQIQHLSALIERVERAGGDTGSRLESKFDAVAGEVQRIDTKIKIATTVGLILAAIVVAAAGILWTVSQDTVAEIAKSAINQAIISASQQTPPPAPAQLPAK